MARVQLKNVEKTFNKNKVLKGINVEVPDGSFMVMVGPSGCGKSTALRCIAGLEEVTGGSIFIGDEDVTSKEPKDRNIAMVFQNYALYPHMNVFDNITYGLKVRGIPADERKRRAEDAAKLLGLDGLLDRMPKQLSGGQRQRVAMGRAIVREPSVFLFDEPLSNLDPKLRETMRFEIKELQKKFNFTIIFVTHDQSEAMALSDRMMVMDMGNIVQIGTPTELYNRPVNRFVHKFLGQSTFTDVVIQDGKVYAKGDMAQPLPVALPENGEREMVMATRPNQIEMNHTDGYKTKVEKRIFLTNYTEYLVRVGDQLLQVQTPHRNAFAQGETCYLKFPGIMWYGREDEQAEAERNRRQLV